MTIVSLPGRQLPHSESCEVIYRHGHRVVCVRGEHDASTASALSSELMAVMRLDERDVVVDLHRVAFMDASTIGALMSARAFLAARGRALRLEAPSNAARRVLQLCGIAYDAVPAHPAAPALRLLSEDDSV